MTLISSPRTAAAMAAALSALAAAGCGTTEPAANAGTATTTARQSDPSHPLTTVRGGTFVLKPVLFPTSTSRDPIHLAPLAPAHGNEQRVVMPVSGGQVVARTAKRGSFRVDGGFRITGGRQPIVVKDLFVDLTTGDIFGVLNGSRTRVLRLDRADLRPGGAKATVSLQRVGLRLAPPLSQALDDAYGVHTFPAGMPFGRFAARLKTAG